MSNTESVNDPVSFIAQSINELLNIEQVNVIDVKTNNIVVDVQATNQVIQVIPSPTTLNIVTNTMQYLVLTITDGQTQFTLSSIPISFITSLLFLDGVKKQYNVDYTIENNILTWLNNTILTTNNLLEIYYF